MAGPSTTEQWAIYRAMPEWEVTVRMSRTARFRVHADAEDGAAAWVMQGANGVRSMEDLYTPDGLVIDEIISVEAVE